jgi:hypothetical protein
MSVASAAIGSYLGPVRSSRTRRGALAKQPSRGATIPPIAAMERLMGIVLVAIATEMFLSGGSKYPGT